jgi:hypothetical protein
MGGFSAFAPTGAIVFSGKEPAGKTFYRSITASLPIYDQTPGTHAEAKAYAQAMALARASRSLRKAQNQADPRTAGELLPLLEEDFKAFPAARASLTDRRAALSALELLPSGAVATNIIAGLRALLGAAFLAYRPVAVDEATVYPADWSASGTTKANPQRSDRAPKFVRLVDPVASLGAPLWVAYANVDATAAPVALTPGDVVMVQPGNSALSERVTVTAVRVIAVAGTGARSFQATFTRPHDLGAVVTTQSWPYWWSTKRQDFIVVTHAAAIDPETRRRIDEFMGRVSRAVTRWAIVEPTTPGALTIGPLTVGSPVGCVPVGQLPFTLSL